MLKTIKSKVTVRIHYELPSDTATRFQIVRITLIAYWIIIIADTYLADCITETNSRLCICDINENGLVTCL